MFVFVFVISLVLLMSMNRGFPSWSCWCWQTMSQFWLMSSVLITCCIRLWWRFWSQMSFGQFQVSVCLCVCKCWSWPSLLTDHVSARSTPVFFYSYIFFTSFPVYFLPIHHLLKLPILVLSILNFIHFFSVFNRILVPALHLHIILFFFSFSVQPPWLRPSVTLPRAWRAGWCRAWIAWQRRCQTSRYEESLSWLNYTNSPHTTHTFPVRRVKIICFVS